MLKDNNRFSEKQIKFFAIQLILGLQHLHDINIMHRNLKLDNLLLDEHGYLKIVDFGMARVLLQDQTSFERAGTPAYLAPELLKGDGHAFPADWWAVGIIMFQMLTGVLPFHSRSQERQEHMIQDQEHQIPNAARIPHSADFADLVNKLLTKDPEDRIGTNGGADEIFAHQWF